MKERILLVTCAPDCASASAMFHDALHQAASEDTLSFGAALPARATPEEMAILSDFGTVRWAAPAQSAWESVLQLWQGETYILICSCQATFSRHWDRMLVRCYRNAHHGSAGAVLTGYLPRDMDPVDAVSPVAVSGFDEQRRLRFSRGTPLRYAAKPARAAFLHPDFVFAPSAFYQEVLSLGRPYFLSAFRQRWLLFTPNCTPIRLPWDQPLLPCDIPTPSEDLTRFGQRFGIDFDRCLTSSGSRMGIYTADLRIPMRVPPVVRLQEALRSLDNRVTKLTPLCVTCRLAIASQPRDAAMVCFRRMAEMINVAMLCFTDHDSVRTLSLSHPNVMEFKGRYGYPTNERITRKNAQAYLRISKVFLLAAAQQKQPKQSHYLWVDFDYLRYPVYPKAALDWQVICGDRITIACVDGQPDPSMICVPRGRLAGLVRDVTSVIDAETSRIGCWPEEQELWRRLLRDRPDQYQVLDLPGKRELFSLTMVTRAEEWGIPGRKP